ncbi:MAG: FAD-dependent oxidoreductase [Planctomycetaceae bacterium]|nr:FAD-dependent oxidoreductase [Planctomycetaceae bacterium]
MLRTFIASIALFLLTCDLLQADEPTYDVVVYGGTSSGVAAAVQVKRMGKSTVIIEPGHHLGGLTSGGLGMTDSGNKAVIGGISREFYQRVKKHYDQPSAWKYERSNDYPLYRAADDAMWTFEPHVAEMIFEQLVIEHDIPIVRQQRLNRETGVHKNGQRIISITMESGEVYRGRMFIDATYEGDLMAAAGVTYAVGRENNASYGETLNGVQKHENTHNHRFTVKVDPYVVPGDSRSGLLPGIHRDPPGEEGAGDDRVQAYCFRMCMSNVASNRVPFPKPAGYEEKRFELLLRNFEAGDLRFPMHPAMMPNGKTDTNNSGAFSTDNIGMNYDYPDASYERREAIIAEHETYQKGFMWTLANHPRVPQTIRDEMATWGLAADEFPETDNWPHQLYIREARRMVGDYVITELDCRRTRIAEDSVGMGSYNMDSHNVQRYVSSEGFAKNEGDVQVSPGGAYSISYRSLVPKAGECENLLVPVCLSSSHIAYGSIRMEPVFMVLGQSAATAAVLCLDQSIAVQHLSYASLSSRLLADEQVLAWTQSPPREVISIAPKSLKGTVLDDEAMEQTGIWRPSTSNDHFVGAKYWHDGNSGQGLKSVCFRHTPSKNGRFEIRLAYTPHSNRATNVPITIEQAGTATKVVVNQRVTPPIDGAFISLGTFEFEDGQAVTITISNARANGYVIADAVQIVPTE